MTADLGASSDHIQESLCGLKWRMVPCEQQLITGQSVLSSRQMSLILRLRESGVHWIRSLYLVLSSCFCESITGPTIQYHAEGNESQDSWSSC